MADPSTAAPFSKRMLQYADIGIALMLVLIVGMMIIPMPTMLLDVLLALNITFGVVVLLSTFYVRQALEIAAFPTILLIATLWFRVPLLGSLPALYAGLALFLWRASGYRSARSPADRRRRSGAPSP